MSQETGTGVDTPVDVELISESIDLASEMGLSTPTREAIDTRTAELVGHLNLLLGEDLGTADPEVRELFRQGYRLLDLKTRPSQSTPSFSAFSYMGAVTQLTGRLLWIYVDRAGADDS
ncbi:hypothetical protein [Streptomyces hypolithicus]